MYALHLCLLHDLRIWDLLVLPPSFQDFHYYDIRSRAYICCKKDKVRIVLLHHTDFLFLLFQSVSKGVDITSIFCSLQSRYLQMSWAGLEGKSDGYTSYKSTMDPLEIINIMPL